MDAPAPLPWSELGPNTGRAFTEPLGVIATAAAVTSTAAFSSSGLDHDARRAVGESFASEGLGDASVFLGYVLPVLVPASLFASGAATSRRSHWVHASAATQAVVVTFAATLALKLTTGRPFPLHGAPRDAADRYGHQEHAREWNFFAPGRGLAWPSGHASATFALAGALSASTADTAVTIASAGVAAGVSLGMLVGDHHYLSDVVAGSLLGLGVGDAVGRGFRARFLGANDARGVRVSLLPGLSPSVPGFRVSVSGL